MFRLTVRDRAIASAKSLSHAQVDRRHVLWALAEELGDDLPETISRDHVRAALQPAGTSIDPPSFTGDAEDVLARIDSRSDCCPLAIELAEGLEQGQPRPSQTGLTDASEAGRVGDFATEVHPQVEARPHSEVAHREESLTQILAELEGLVGLHSVKREVKRLVAVQRANAERRSRRLPEVRSSNHLVFTGSAGTGKTTVARLIARLYGAIGVVAKGQLVEVSRSDLVAGYVGQTALKVEKVVKQALGGVLFIDEAYALSLDTGAGYGSEAIATLVKLMEDHREDLVVIVAGYDDEMRQFVASNSGLKSRFSRFLHFPDYNADELTQIFSAFARDASVRLGEGVEDCARGLFVHGSRSEGFGNARFARTLFEEAFANMAARAFEDDRIDEGELELMIVDDLPAPGVHRTVELRRVGFRPAALDPAN